MANNMIDRFNSYYFSGTPESEALNKAYSDLYGQAYRAKQEDPTDPRYFYFPSEQSATELTEWQKQKAANMGINPNATDPTLLSMWLKSIGTQPGSMYKGAEDYQAWAAPYLQQIEQQRQREAQERNAAQAFEREMMREMMREAQVGERLGSFYRQATQGVGRAYQDYLYGPSSPQERTLQESQTRFETSGLQWRERNLAELQRIAADPTYRPQRMDLYGEYINNPQKLNQEIEKLKREISDIFSEKERFLRERQSAEQQIEEERRMAASGPTSRYDYIGGANYESQYQKYLDQLQGLAARGFYQTSTPQYTGVTNIPSIPAWTLTASQKPAQPAATSNYAAMAQQIPSGPAMTQAQFALVQQATQRPVGPRPVPTRPQSAFGMGKLPQRPTIQRTRNPLNPYAFQNT